MKEKPLFPVKDKKIKDISSSYGKRIHPITGEEDFHKGIDIPANEGTEILSPEDGWVTGSGEDEILGNFIVLLTKSENRINMFHLKEVIITSGVVKKGQVVGRVGNTGKWTTGPHLHFQVAKQSDPPKSSYDPLEYFGLIFPGDKENFKKTIISKFQEIISDIYILEGFIENYFIIGEDEDGS